MPLTPGVQDYLKVIYNLQQDGGFVTNSQLAEHFGVSAPAVTDMIKKLDQGVSLVPKGVKVPLVDYQSRGGVRLTAEGERVALEIIRHHRLIELYLVKALGMSWDEVHQEAEVLEHVLSETLEDRMSAYLGEPQFDPHGAPIPARDGSLPRRPTDSLLNLDSGQQALIAEVDDSDPAKLRYLAELGLVPDAPITVIRRAPFNGPLVLRVGAAEGEQVIAAEMAGLILVRRD